ncbi:hypothetical protein KDD30_01875 [Photobacterium sp. GJ3]|uniref:hypothetical protein n=1 Tax=Photobacterium sp. GJ3 TaxID=2829502 RepID=UPI001B8C5025|nr:hypothetical protein [Photobacterium sp. GJ3]QUJ67933.1 hypothetical protein KDD30_01875 [Photobacterium sp. GJ3]
MKGLKFVGFASEYWEQPRSAYFQTEIFCEYFVVIGFSYHEFYHYRRGLRGHMAYFWPLCSAIFTAETREKAAYFLSGELSFPTDFRPWYGLEIQGKRRGFGLGERGRQVV